MGVIPPMPIDGTLEIPDGWRYMTLVCDFARASNNYPGPLSAKRSQSELEQREDEAKRNQHPWRYHG